MPLLDTDVTKPPQIQRLCFVRDVIRRIHAKTSFSQEKLAEKADLSTVFISRVEREKESPSVDSLVKIAGALRTRVRDLVREF